MLRFITLFASALLLVAPMPGAGASESSVGERSSWLNDFFDERAPQYKDVQHCVEFTSTRLNLPPELLVSVMMVENGGLNPRRLNNNGTYDHGIFQINDVRMPEIEHFNISKEDLIHNNCLNVFVGGYILKREIRKAGDFLVGVGNYHYGRWGRYPENHYRYIERVFNTWKSLL